MRIWKHASLVLCVIIMMNIPQPLQGAARGAPHMEGVDTFEDLLSVPLEQLTQMDYVIYSASKKAEKVSETPSAAYVISQEDIRRSGVTTIAEALRMAPGVQVARIDAHSWAISARGFNGDFATKLLVLIDGRSVYTISFGGVFWQTKDLMLEDVERIEVIRGSGAALWGANAVNGVINIITKHSKDTQGGLVTAAAGNQERLGAMRYGGTVGSHTSYRIYGQGKDRSPQHLLGNGEAPDPWDIEQGGFRVDSAPTKEHRFTLNGDIYNGQEQQLKQYVFFTPPYQNSYIDEKDFSGGNLSGSWQHLLENDSTLNVLAYYNNEQSGYNSGYIKVNTVNADLQHAFTMGERQEWIWGGGYRYVWDDISGIPTQRQMQKQATIIIYNAFFQDKIAVVPEKLFLTLSSKFEYHQIHRIGFQLQPSAKLNWRIDSNHSLWASVARAARVPSHSERGLEASLFVIPASPPLFPFLFGNREQDAETLNAYELGYRAQLTETVRIDHSVFYNRYHRLLAFVPEAPQPQSGYVVLPFVSRNTLYGETYGAEIAADWHAFVWLKLKASYSYIHMQLHSHIAAAESSAVGTEGNVPRHSFHIRSYVDLPHNWEFDTALYYVDEVPNRNGPAYLRADARIGWRPRADIELSLIGQNLFDDRHLESLSSVSPNQIEIERSVYGKIAITF